MYALKMINRTVVGASKPLPKCAHTDNPGKIGIRDLAKVAPNAAEVVQKFKVWIRYNMFTDNPYPEDSTTLKIAAGIYWEQIGQCSEGETPETSKFYLTN